MTADDSALDAVYALVATLYEDADQPDQAMTICAALMTLGEERSWATVWWAYGATHHDLADEALAGALALLPAVDRSPWARAAALMLQAEIEDQSAAYDGGRADPARQTRLLSEAVQLAPAWPGLHLRLARACADAGDDATARHHATETMRLIDDGPAEPTAFERALTGHGLIAEAVTSELRGLALLET